MVADSVRFFVREGRRAVFDAEHFFDGYAADRSYALACLSAAAEAGADTLALCDTNGGAPPRPNLRVLPGGPRPVPAPPGGGGRPKNPPPPGGGPPGAGRGGAAPW